MRSRVALVLLLLAVAGIGTRAGDRIDFGRQIRPILSDNCYQCHGPDEGSRASELRLDQRESALGDHGGLVAVSAGDPDASEVIRRLESTDEDVRMPPPATGRTLSAEQIALIRQWISEGAEWKEHWSFVSPDESIRPPVSEEILGNDVDDGSAERVLVEGPIDCFVRDRLRREGLSASEACSDEVLVRRVTLDLTGLPPTLEALDRYLRDSSPDRYERLVDRLLASPAYGEHLAVAWLDAARYSDTNGYQNDGTRTMWPWRDWLIESLNRNMPFDEFTVLQTAGDLLPNATQDQKIATGFHRNHPLNGEGGRIPEESRVEYVFDRTETLGTVWLGLTVGCARCHDHKYDPLSQKEYYQLFAYFNSIDEQGGVDRGGNANPVVRVATARQMDERAELLAEQHRVGEELSRLTRPKGTSLGMWFGSLHDSLARGMELQRTLRSIRGRLGSMDASMTDVMILKERKKPRATHVLERGAYDKPDTSESLEPGTPAVLPSIGEDAKNRLGLARWLVDASNPLTARVTVNRYWQGLFGSGLVRTPEDFGSQGEPPTHPDLFDWLAVEFRRTGWNVKGLHRSMVTSGTYRQTSRVSGALLEADPENRLLARGPRGRLSSLALRDQALFVSGLLVDTMCGPGVNPYQPDDVWTDFSLGKISYQRDKGAALYRRSVYVFWRRSVGPTMFFDVPNRQVCEVRPRRTNTPLHALTRMNETGAFEASRVLAERVIREAGPTAADRIGMAFRLLTSRYASPMELEVLLESLDRSLETFRSDPESAERVVGVGDWQSDPNLDRVELAAYTATMNVILNLDEAQTKE